jgi:hypothetical protein
VDKINNKLKIGQMTPRGVRSYKKKSPMNPTWGDTFFDCQFKMAAAQCAQKAKFGEKMGDWGPNPKKF